MKTSNLRNRVIVLITLIFLVVFILILVPSLNKKGKVRVELVLAPPVAEITVDGVIQKKQTLYLAPGSHTFKARLDEFEENTQVVNIQQPTTVRLLLTPQTAKAKELADKYEEIYSEAEAAAGEEASNAGSDFIQKNPIATKLPRIRDYYRIDYANKSGKFVVQITANNSLGRRVALEQIKDWGYDPADYIIEFPNLINPFASRGDTIKP